MARAGSTIARSEPNVRRRRPRLKDSTLPESHPSKGCTITARRSRGRRVVELKSSPRVTVKLRSWPSAVTSSTSWANSAGLLVKRLTSAESKDTNSPDGSSRRCPGPPRSERSMLSTEQPFSSQPYSARSSNVSPVVSLATGASPLPPCQRTVRRFRRHCTAFWVAPTKLEDNGRKAACCRRSTRPEQPSNAEPATKRARPERTVPLHWPMAEP
mmetsp:Transcript_65340/g.142385  ORF Transcript_65340/g.142385 Transcript_65340/m.142385 type:complete len:214 (-) Transcript_65340:47-688(-)